MFVGFLLQQPEQRKHLPCPQTSQPRCFSSLSSFSSPRLCSSTPLFTFQSKRHLAQEAFPDFLGASLHAIQFHNLYQFSSVTQSCPTLCDPMNRSTPGLPVHHQLPEFTQTHVHRVSDAIQPSHPLSSPSPPAPNPSQNQSLFQ